jgi:hypothetical protein
MERIINYPSIDFRSKYIMESMLVSDPHIIHQFWTFFDIYLKIPKEQAILYLNKLLSIG